MSGPNPPYEASSGWWVVLLWRLGTVHESLAHRLAGGIQGLDMRHAADAGLGLLLWGSDNCLWSVLGGAQCGEQCGPDLKHGAVPSVFCLISCVAKWIKLEGGRKEGRCQPVCTLHPCSAHLTPGLVTDSPTHSRWLKVDGKNNMCSIAGDRRHSHGRQFSTDKESAA